MHRTARAGLSALSGRISGIGRHPVARSVDGGQMDLSVVGDLEDDPSGVGSLVVRTDFSDDGAWLRTQTALMTPVPMGMVEYDEMEPLLTFVENPRFEGFAGEQFVAEVTRRKLFLDHLFFADRRAQVERDHPVPVVDLVNEAVDDERITPGRTFRVQADQVGNRVSPNLAIGNMSFWEFADVADATQDGVFRGFPE